MTVVTLINLTSSLQVIFQILIGKYSYQINLGFLFSGTPCIVVLYLQVIWVSSKTLTNELDQLYSRQKCITMFVSYLILPNADDLPMRTIDNNVNDGRCMSLHYRCCFGRDVGIPCPDRAIHSSSNYSTSYITKIL